MSTHKIIIASTLILNEQKDLLVVRKKKSNYYMLPGGKVEPTETHIDALIRELNEELNLIFKETDFTFLGQHETQAANELNTIVQGNIFLLKSTIQNLPTANAELEEVRYINKAEYTQYQLAHLLKEFALPIWRDL